MEAVVHEYLLPQFPQLLEQASLGDVKKEWGIEIFFEGISPQKKFDFAVLSESKKIFLIEVNYYSGGGSKLSAVAGHYKDYERFINEGETSFIWITDGLGWKTAKNDLEDTFLNNDYVFSLKMISENILNEVIK
jgi:type II restriction enzyme